MTCGVVLRLQLSPEPDALARVLGVVLVAQAEIRSASYVSGPDCGSSSLELAGLDAIRAETLKRRLEALPCVMGLLAPATSTTAGSGSGPG